MENLSVGRSGVSVNGIGLDGGKWDREVDQETSLRVMDYAVENGEVIEALERAVNAGKTRFMGHSEVRHCGDNEEAVADRYRRFDRLGADWRRRI